MWKLNFLTTPRSNALFLFIIFFQCVMYLVVLIWLLLSGHVWCMRAITLNMSWKKIFYLIHLVLHWNRHNFLCAQYSKHFIKNKIYFYIFKLRLVKRKGKQFYLYKINGHNNHIMNKTWILNVFPIDTIGESCGNCI